MANRVRYPLTEQAKKAATWLVEEWVKGNLPQLFGVVDANSGIMIKGKDRNDSINDSLPDKATFFELAQFRLISIRYIPQRLPEERPGYIDHWGYSEWWEILLLDELRSAVRNNFAVSDFFLTTAAVGTIIQGDLTVHPNASYQSAASISGDIVQTVEQLSTALETQLGTLLDTDAELRAAIKELRSAKQSEQVSKVGKVIMELGRCLQHGANAAMILSVLPLLIQCLSRLLG